MTIRRFISSAAAGGFLLSVLHAATPASTSQALPAPHPIPSHALNIAAPVPQQAQTAAATGAPRGMFDQDRIGCHNDRAKTGNVSLEGVSVTDTSQANAELLERVVRKLRVDAMPPAGSRRPDQATMQAFLTSLEGTLDQAVATKPNPGRTETFHRMNRAEYGNAVRDLLGLKIDAASLLPPDDASFGFDNIGGVLKISPTFADRYTATAQKISRAAVGSLNIPPAETIIRLTSDLNQDDYFEGLPLGTRGGTVVEFNFPLDAEYDIGGELLGRRPNEPHTLEATIDGERIQTAVVGERPTGGRGAGGGGGDNDDGDYVARSPGFKVRVPVKAGPHVLGVAFVRKSGALPVNQREAFVRPTSGAFSPQLGTVTIGGPFNATGPGDTPSRRKIFVCQPTGKADEERCAKEIITKLARVAYRRPVTARDLTPLMKFFAEGRAIGGRFDEGIELALRRILVSPGFLFRIARDPEGAAPGTDYRVSDVELASRLSFFLWSSIPDDELLTVAERGQLKDPAVLKGQVRRMLVDPKSQALVDNFAGQWLYLRNVPIAVTDGSIFPEFDAGLRGALYKETQLFFSDILHDDKAKVLDLLNANYTYLNGQLAAHYGIPGVHGPAFRRVTLPAESSRGGILTHGSILLATSYAARTAPTIRGKWIMATLLGVPPPDPPPVVPALKENKDGQAIADKQSVRARLEQHRQNAACSGCHKLMDPIGLSLENFDATGKWRTVSEDGTPIDAASTLFDGANVAGPVELRNALMKHSQSIVRTATERLLTYALGRGLEYYDQPAIRKIAHEAGNADASFTNIIIGIVNSVPFQMRRAQS